MHHRIRTGNTTILAAFFSGLLAVASPVVAQAADGAALYKDNCAKCHGETGRAESWRGHLFFAQNFWKPGFQQANSDEDILAQINRGPRIMPSFEKSLTLEERQALVKYIREMGAKAGVPPKGAIPPPPPK